MADDVLHSGVRGVTDLMIMPGLINLDFADIRTVMSEMGKAMMGTGEADGDRRAIDAAEAAISNPLLEDVSMKGARGVLINITGGTDMTLFEVDEAANRIREEVDPEANIIFGSTFDEKLAGKMRISVVATGIDAESLTRAVARGTGQPGRPAGGETVPRDAHVGGYTQPMLTQNAAQNAHQNGAQAAAPAHAAVQAHAVPHAPPPAPQARAEASRPDGDPEPVPHAEAAESAAMRGGAFIAQKPVDAGPVRPVPVTQSAVPAAARDAQVKPKGRVPSLIERMTGVARARVSLPGTADRTPRPAAPPPAPVPRPTQPRLAALDPEERPGLSKEDDLLDIPTFLRRQTN
jgi:cell division protein FtsZ